MKQPKNLTCLQAAAHDIGMDEITTFSSPPALQSIWCYLTFNLVFFFFFWRELAVPFTGHSWPRQDKVNADRSRFHYLFYRLFLCLFHMACEKWGDHDDLRSLHAKNHYFLFLFLCSRIGLDLWSMMGPYRPKKKLVTLSVFF